LTNRIAPAPDELGRFIFYQTEEGGSRVEVLLDEGSVWLTQNGLANLDQTSKQNITAVLERRAHVPPFSGLLVGLPRQETHRKLST